MAKAKLKTMDCEFKNVGIGKDVARMSVSVPRENLSLDQADELFTGSQVSVQMSCDPGRNDDADGQQTIKGCTLELAVIADCHGFRTSSDGFNASLSMNKDAVDLPILSKFASRRGSIKIKRTGAAAGTAEPGEENNGDD